MQERKPEVKSIKVLDKGHVEYVDHMGSDLLVVNAARVSFAKESEFDYDTKEEIDPDTRSIIEYRSNFRLKDKDKKLISYLAKHQHWTPFAHPQICLRIKAPISIRTQLFKHKVGFVENEISRRYVTEDPEVYNPRWRDKPTNGAKQGSDDFMEYDDNYNYCYLGYDSATEHALGIYRSLLAKGVAPEQARFVLPQGTYTEWFWTGSLAAYARVCKLRSDPHAQWEVREYSAAISNIISELFPESWKVLTAK
jgi:thymidylate synthase (FAD)